MLKFIIRKANKALATALAKRFGYMTIGKGHTKRHYSLNITEAIEWAACYRKGATIYRCGVFVAQRTRWQSPTVDKGITRSA